MTRMLCIAQAHPTPRRARGKAAKGKDTPSIQATATARFTVLERVPIGLAAHKPVWDVLRKYATRQDIIDDAHPEDALAAEVVAVDKLSADAVAAIASVLAERRAMIHAAEKDTPGSEILGKGLDRIMEQELEWLLIRNLLAAALRAPRSGARRKAKSLLLIEA